MTKTILRKFQRIKKDRREKNLFRQEVLLYQRILEGMRRDFSFDDILKLLVTSVTEGLGYDRAGIFLLQANGTTLDLALGIDDRKKYEKKPGIFHLQHRPGVNPFSDILFGYKKYFLSNRVKNRKIRLDKRVLNHAIVPLEIGRGQIIGLLAVDNLFKPRFISKTDLAILTNFATQAGLAIESFRLHEKVRELNLKDSLTGAFNRRYFDQFLPQELRRCRRYRRPLSLLYLDIDHFKAINDNHGHQAGDSVLKKTAAILQNGLRDVDILVRLGGDEFAVILPEIGAKEAPIVADRLFRRIGGSSGAFEENLSPGQKITISMGQSFFADWMKDPEELMRLADESLYRAKASGRNQLGPLLGHKK